MANGILDDPDTTLLKAIIGTLVHKLGGSVVFTQEDFDNIAGFVIGERWVSPDAFQLEVVLPTDKRLPMPKEKAQ